MFNSPIQLFSDPRLPAIFNPLVVGKLDSLELLATWAPVAKDAIAEYTGKFAIHQDTMCGERYRAFY